LLAIIKFQLCLLRFLYLLEEITKTACSGAEESKTRESREQGDIGPSARDMTVFTNISSNNRFPVNLVPETSSETESRVEVPGVSARAKRTLNGKFPSFITVEASPNAGCFEVPENPSEEHVLALLVGVDAARPVAEVQAIITELSRQKLAALFPPQIPIPASQMRLPAGLRVFCGIPISGDAGVAEAGAADGELEEGGAGGGGIGEE